MRRTGCIGLARHRTAQRVGLLCGGMGRLSGLLAGIALGIAISALASLLATGLQVALFSF